MNAQTSGGNQQKRARFRYVISIVISVIALVVAGIHIGWADAQVDSITVALLAIAATPWLGEILESIELPGGTKLKYRIRELEERADRQEEQISENKGRAESALAQSEAATTASAISSGVPGTMEVGLQPMIDKYNRVRASQGSGGSRTAAMTSIAGEMIAIAPAATDFPVAQALSMSGGMRLAAYAILNVRPDPSLLHPLVESLTARDPNQPHLFAAQPFEQYWGILALRKTLALVNREQIDERDIDALYDLLRQLRPGTDRHFELSRALRVLSPPSSSP